MAPSSPWSASGSDYSRERRYSATDHLLVQFDRALRTLFGMPRATGRSNPADTAPDGELSIAETRHAARLMRVNHTGEVCAQALYQGQLLSARHEAVRAILQQAAVEEGDHLAWCQRRIDELGGSTSLLNPLFYGGSLAMGAVAGLSGDRWNMGFLNETERQVEQHLDRHLQRLPEHDYKSRAVLAAMQDDEQRHAASAEQAGGARLPLPLRLLMKATSKVMTRTAYWI